MGSSVRKFVGAVAPIIAGAAVAFFGPIGAVAGAILVGGSALLGGRLRFGVREGARHELRYNTSTTQATLNLIYGKRIVGSNDVFVELTNKNKTLWIVHCLGEGEIEGIEVDTEGKPLITIAGRKFKDYPAGKVKYYFHSGTNDQAVDANLHAAITKFTDTMRNTAYIVFELDFSTFKSIPNREVVIKGIKVKDFTNPTAPAAWSENPVLALYDYITNARYGLGWDPSLIDLDTWVSAKNYCDNHVKPWKFNYVVTSQVNSQSIIDTILYHFRGVLTYYAGKLFCHYLEDAPSIFSVVDEHIVRSDDGLAFVSVSQPSTHDLPNTALVRYVSPNLEWADDDFVIGEAISGKVRTIDFPGYTDRALAAEMAVYILERERLNRIYTATLRLDTVVIDVNDVINFASTELLLGIDPARKYRVKESVVLSDGLVQITFVEDNAELYDAVYNDNQERYIIDIYSPYDPPPPVINIAFEEELYTFRGRTFIRLKCTFEPPAEYAFYAYSNIYVRAGDTGEFTQLTSVVDNFSMESVEEKITYYFRFWSVSTEGTLAITAAEASHYVVGISTLPPINPLALEVTISGDSVTLSSEEVYQQDIPEECNLYAWDFRLNNDLTAGYGGALLISKKSTPFYSFTGLIPGEYKFFVNTLGRNEVYGTTPADKNDKKFDPPIAFEHYFDDPISYVTGQHFNTETVGGELKCILSSPSLSGYYLTQVKQLVPPLTEGEGVITSDTQTLAPTNLFCLSRKTAWDKLSIGDFVQPLGQTGFVITGKYAFGSTFEFDDAIVTDNDPTEWLEVNAIQYDILFIGSEIRWVHDPAQINYTVLEKHLIAGEYWITLDQTIYTPMPNVTTAQVYYKLPNAIGTAVAQPAVYNIAFSYRESVDEKTITALGFEYYMSGSVPYSYAGGLHINLYYGPSSTGPWTESTDLQLLTSNIDLPTAGVWYYMRYDLLDYSPTPAPDPATRKQIIIKPSTLKIYRRTQ